MIKDKDDVVEQRHNTLSFTIAHVEVSDFHEEWDPVGVKRTWKKHESIFQWDIRRPFKGINEKFTRKCPYCDHDIEILVSSLESIKDDRHSAKWFRLGAGIGLVVFISFLVLIITNTWGLGYLPSWVDAIIVLLILGSLIMFISSFSMQHENQGFFTYESKNDPKLQNDYHYIKHYETKA